MTQLINLIIGNLQLGKAAIQLTGKLMQLAANNKAAMTPADLACLANTVKFIRLRAQKSEKARVKSAPKFGIFMSARVLQLKLPSGWWELFDAQKDEMDAVVAQISALPQEHFDC